MVNSSKEAYIEGRSRASSVHANDAPIKSMGSAHISLTGSMQHLRASEDHRQESRNFIVEEVEMTTISIP